jgi:hypothetical protein
MRLSLAAILALGFGFAGGNTSQAQDEARGPVPVRANPNNPEAEVYRATAVIGMPVRDRAGNEIGQIKDLVIDGRNREVLFAVLAMNAAPGRDVVYVMPWSVFQPAYGQGATITYAVLGVPPNVLMQAPSFTWVQWQRTPFTTWAPQVTAYYSRFAPAAVGAGVGAGVGVGRAGQTGRRGTAIPGPDSAVPDQAPAPRGANPRVPAVRDPANPADEPRTAPEKNPNAPKVKPQAPAPKETDDADEADPKSKDANPPAAKDDANPPPKEVNPPKGPKEVNPPKGPKEVNPPKEPKQPKAPQSKDE